MKTKETTIKDSVLQHADNPDGINVADASLKGVGMRDVQESAIKDRGGKRKGLGADIMSSMVNGVSNVPDGLGLILFTGCMPLSWGQQLGTFCPARM